MTSFSRRRSFVEKAKEKNAFANYYPFQSRKRVVAT